MTYDAMFDACFGLFLWLCLPKSMDTVTDGFVYLEKPTVEPKNPGMIPSENGISIAA